MEKEIKVKMHVSFSVVPDCNVELPSVDETVSLMPVAVAANDAYAVVSTVLEHWKRAFRAGGDVQEVIGEPLARAIDAARSQLGIEGETVVSK